MYTIYFHYLRYFVFNLHLNLISLCIYSNRTSLNVEFIVLRYTQTKKKNIK